MKPKAINLTEGNVTKNLLLFAIPILLSNLFQQLYNAVDTMVVGKFAGSIALAAVGSTSALICLLIDFFLGIATGAGILYAMHYGAGDYKGLKKLIDSSVIIAITVSIVIMAIGIGFSDKLLSMMNIPGEVLGEAKDYFVIYLYGTLPMLIYNIGAGLIRAEGDSSRPLIYLVISGVINMIVDIVLVAGFDLGTKGAAWATVASQIIAAILVMIRLTKLNDIYAWRPLKMQPDKLTIWDITRISVPCGLSHTMFNFANLIIQTKINSFGAIAMAGTAAYNKIDSFMYMPMSALCLATSTFVGQNVGAGKFSRIKEGIKASAIAGVLATFTLMAIVFVFFKPLMSLFTADEEVISYARIMMLYLVPFTWIYAIADTLTGAIRGAGQATQVTVILAITICVCRLAWLAIALPIKNEINIVFMSYPISWTLCTLTMIWYFFKRSTVYKTIKSCEDIE